MLLLDQLVQKHYIFYIIERFGGAYIFFLSLHDLILHLRLYYNQYESVYNNT